MTVDTLIAGGRVFDPGSRTIRQADIAIDRGRIHGIEPAIDRGAAAEVIDADGCVVTPGLVDIHSHVYWRGSPISIDAEALAPTSGVTTWVDAGSAYATTVEGLRERIVQQAGVRVLAFLRLGRGTNEITPANEIAAADAELTAAVARRNRDFVVGLKVSLGQSDLEPLRIALHAAALAELPLMVHIAQAPPDVSSALALLRPGDIVTHSLTGQTMKLVDDEGVTLPAAQAARERGVLFDLGHGAGSFSWRTAEALFRAGFWPDTISTDVWQVSALGPMFDLPTCISKLVHLGMPLTEALYAVTARPAEIVGRAGDFGTLHVGAQADLALLRMAEGEFPLYDAHREERRARILVRAAGTFVRGRRLPPRPEHPLAAWLDFALTHGGMDPNPQGGVRPAVREFQAALAERGHLPWVMAP